MEYEPPSPLPREVERDGVTHRDTTMGLAQPGVCHTWLPNSSAPRDKWPVRNGKAIGRQGSG